MTPLAVPRRASRPTGARLCAVTLDAMGTVVALEDPAPRLRASLATRLGLHVPLDRCAAAMRAEMRHYRDGCVRAVDAAALERLRLECADVLAEALDLGVGADEVLPVLSDAIAFSLHTDVLPSLDRLRAAGVPVAVVSNWDVSLHDVLADVGVAERFQAVLTSAEVGASKPSPALYRRAAQALGFPEGELLHVGDDPVTDVDGARAAGLEAVLLQRDPGPTARTPRIRTLLELPALLRIGAAPTWRTS